jgi:hypothetical protein
MSAGRRSRVRRSVDHFPLSMSVISKYAQLPRYLATQAPSYALLLENEINSEHQKYKSD